MGAKTQTQPNLKDLGVDGKLADRALRALLKHHESSADKEQLLGNDLDVQVQFSLARIPGNSSPKPIRIELPHALVKTSSGGDDDAMDEDNLQDVEACLIVKEESKPWVQEMIARFPNELGCIKKVLGLQSLRIKHKSFTQRRELLARFDVFFADDRILPMLTKSLGGKFFEKKKQPIPVSLTRKEALPFAIQKSLKSTFMYLSAGTCVTVKAGNTSMSSEKLLANIESITTMVPTKVPRKWSNIRAISIKTSSSVALPIYNKTPEELELIMELVKKEGGKQIEEKKEDSEKGKKKRTVAASTPLAKALKKSKAVEVEAEAEVVEEKPKKSSKKKRKESIDATEVEKKVVAKTPKSSKKKTKEPIETKEEVAVKEVTKTPKSSKKKKKEAVESNDQEEEVVKKEAKTPKSSKKRKSKAEDSTAASAKKTTKKNSDDASTKDSKFISSKKFSGAKKGFVFKKSNLGIGYYKDALPMVDATWLATLSKKAGRSGGRKSMGNTVKRKKGGRRSY
mmetsp:Transcript_30611/g.64765  ORF Transcript_30611/g.64765 Transcript_30611/m.64765 type:complete len:511 (+) Transcript_30611:40-1572(+)|eukprot:CAMPEP_0172297062 /NCGR_PEP_ID=MMETSP1058-20130122/227_1 /TAXON_ID=83371 /ORGANISM="Detonula confervacea, Strain CCMP 353" /LENGTH=510 /DNA_ID=CAMNT_0013006167 /DNA_START=38 /DNA_END=1570 /DNA_ORIENTATION=+